MRDAAVCAPLAFPTIAAKRDERSLAERLGDTLAESYNEDKSPDYRLGLLQGALAIAVPQLISEVTTVNIRVNAADILGEATHQASRMTAAQRTARAVGAAKTHGRNAAKRSRSHA